MVRPKMASALSLAKSRTLTSGNLIIRSCAGFQFCNFHFDFAKRIAQRFVFGAGQVLSPDT